MALCNSNCLCYSTALSCTEMMVTKNNNDNQAILPAQIFICHDEPIPRKGLQLWKVFESVTHVNGIIPMTIFINSCENSNEKLRNNEI